MSFFSLPFGDSVLTKLLCRREKERMSIWRSDNFIVILHLLYYIIIACKYLLVI